MTQLLDNPTINSTDPSTPQGKGWLTKLQSMINACFGPGQTWQNLGPVAQGGNNTRALGQTYTNTTSRPIFLMVTAESTGSGNLIVDIYINGNLIAVDAIYTPLVGYFLVANLPVFPGNTYNVSVQNANLYIWMEGR